MKNSIRFMMSVFIAVGALSFSTAFAEEGTVEQTKSVGAGAKAGKMSKEERKAMRKEMRKMKKEAAADGEITADEKKKMRKARRAHKALQPKKVKEAPPVPTEEQIEEADQEMNQDMPADEDME